MNEALSLLPEVLKRRVLDLHCKGKQTEVSLPETSVPASEAVRSLPVKETCEEIASSHQGIGSFRIDPLSNGLTIINRFISSDDIKEVLAEAQASLLEKQHPAGMVGTATTTSMLTSTSGDEASSILSANPKWHDSSFRGDVMRWLHNAEEHIAGRHSLALLLERMKGLQHQLTTLGYDVGGRISQQVACYPGNGARYVRHRDASPSAPDRVITAICYLNLDWSVEVDGGQLAVYNMGLGSTDSEVSVIADDKGISDRGSCQCTMVPPIGGQLVLFESRIPHEVLPTFKPRYAVTTWFYKKPDDAIIASGNTSGQHNNNVSTTAPVTPFTSKPSLAAEPDSATAPSGATLCSSGSGKEVPNSQGNGDHSGCDHDLRGSGMKSGDTIFVSIASYRDPETRWTVWDLFKKARYPDRIRVGIVWQVDYLEDGTLMTHVGQTSKRPPPWLQYIREVRLPWQEAEGPCWARHLAQQLYCGEEYVLQIDSHMRFVEGWDVLCISQLKQAELAERMKDSSFIQDSAGQSQREVKVVISTYPQGYDGEGASASVPSESQAVLPHMCASSFDEQGMLRFVARALRSAPSHPLPSLFWAAGFSFSRAALMKEVPYPPAQYLPHLFFGEELWMLARMWTRGWRVFTPSVAITFHQWQRSARSHTVNKDHCSTVFKSKEMSQLKVQAVLGVQPWPYVQEFPSKLGGIIGGEGRNLPVGWGVGEVWGLGNLHSSNEFESFIGVKIKSREIELKSTYGGLRSELF
ncbi:hypothetical protein CEUSTIGMA_g4126.t1 [Chlamydomonas eustigma]|uniref:procollagen-lysine 5-dioxygenase n=1 Tax=Chlamydomonas eustigma TaxID=1157962 RepID=A0A250X1S2_9CHLO|nr:hypothetical protein CEUSTIGMA_g4126.t1 [Chlamydomonas eustigma]|eukprot:GAX76680.1 hypothetical protein CEUSTIGMA_g4126.t1 [Chlamydomonas eustigma]